MAFKGDNACEAWANIRGDSNANQIRDSYNVTSMTDNGTGQYYVNFSNNMSNSNYSCVAGGNTSYSGTGGWDTFIGINRTNTNQVQFLCAIPSGRYDVAVGCIAVFGDR